MFKNNNIKMPVFVFCLLTFMAAPVSAQIYADDTLFIGNPDGSPFHVPYQGIVDIPVWMNPYGVGGGSIDLTTPNYAVSERLGGNFYLPWSYTFFEPVYYPEHSRQLLGFISTNPPDSFVHLADFSFRMDIDPSYIGDTLQVMNVMSIFSDSTGTIIIIYREEVSRLVIDDITVIDGIHNNPRCMAALHNYPNPFNATTTIEFTIAETRHVTIEIYDLLGKRIETLIDRYMETGRHQVVWDASGYSSGVYFYRIEAGEFVETKRMVYLK